MMQRLVAEIPLAMLIILILPSRVNPTLNPPIASFRETGMMLQVATCGRRKLMIVAVVVEVVLEVVVQVVVQVVV